MYVYEIAHPKAFILYLFYFMLNFILVIWFAVSIEQVMLNLSPIYLIIDKHYSPIR